MAHAALDLLGGAYGRRVVVVAGKGSNGADGRVAADVLARRGARVLVVDAAEATAGTVLPGVRPRDRRRVRHRLPRVLRRAGVPPGAPVLAIDIPSGVDADTGDAPGDAVAADATVTFAAYKPGLLQGDGARLSGRVEVADIGIAFDVPAGHAHRGRRRRRAGAARGRATGNKWTHAVGVAAGSPGMEGAAVLCTRARMAAGAGMVRLASPG